MTPPRVSGPLVGVRGIVMTQAWAGNWCTSLLGQLGADIVQIEVRRRLDNWRGEYTSPFPARVAEQPTALHPWNASPSYNAVSLNKRCITLDLSTAEGMAVFKRLVPFADFVAENFSPRVMGNFGLDFDALRQIKPDIILASLSAYGHDGPWANVPGIGGTIEPSSGQSALLGYVDGPPLNSGQMYPDPVAALHGVLGIVAALRHRDLTGEGQYIDVSMQETSLSVVGDAAVEYALTGKQRPRLGNRHTTFAPHGIFPARGKERWIAIACESDEQWRSLVEVLGLDVPRERFATNADRKHHEDEIEALIADATSRRDRTSIVRRLTAAGVLVAPVLDALEVAEDAQLLARGLIREIEHPEAGRWPQATLPMHFSQTVPRDFRPAPCQGEHTYEVLAELLDMTTEDVDELVALGVSGSGPPD